MSIESWTSGLHAGLIQRARPGERALAADPADEAPMAGALAGTRGTVLPLRERDRFGRAPAPLRESAIARARGLLGRAPVPTDATIPERATAPATGRPVRSIVPGPSAEPRHGWSFCRRFGLTVRVHAAVRELLFDARLRTGRTTQSILHDALTRYLDRLDGEPGQR